MATIKTWKARIVLRSGKATDWTTNNPVLLAGEIGYELDTGLLKIGDGVKAWKELSYFKGDKGDAAGSEGALTTFMKIADYKGSADGVVKSADKLQTARNINGVAFDGTQDITVADDTKIPKTEKGAKNGVATLDGSGLIPSSQLPSYVDDVIEGYISDGKFYSDSQHVSAITGESGKIYVDIPTGTEYRFSGTGYISISNPLDIASVEEAKAGTDDTKAMTPAKTKAAIDARGYITSTDATNKFEPKIANKGTAFNKNFGTTAGSVTEGNDARLSDARIPKGAAGGSLTGTYPNPTIANGAVTDAMIAAGNSLSTSKMFVPDGDTLIIDGGKA